MLLKDLKEDFSKQLSEIYPKTEIDTFFVILIEEYLGLQRIDIVLQPNFLINEEKYFLLESALQKLQKEEPIQYIIGKTEFYGYPFFVDKHTLIPRPETEELVAWILEEISNKKHEKGEELSILDIGTGTGCIPITLSKNLPKATITAIDISKETLEVAQKNACLNKVNVNFIEADILKTTSLQVVKSIQNQFEHKKITFDVIVSNPPYVRELEKVEIKNNVLENEPHIALFVTDDNPLIFYNKIADLAKQHLAKNGSLFFEINQYLGKETAQVLKNKEFKNIILKKDIFKNDRMIKATL